MARICDDCHHYQADGSVLHCPQCDKPMRATVLPPPGTLPSMETELRELAACIRYEVMESSASRRCIQALVAVAIWSFILTRGTRGMSGLLGMPFNLAPPEQLFTLDGVLLLANLALIAVASLSAGCIAGFRTNRWTQQGWMLAGLIMIFPVLVTVFGTPEIIVALLAGLAVNIPFVFAGSYLGSRLIPPHRVPQL
jgi:hypothetical protein